MKLGADGNVTVAGYPQFMFVLAILEKIKKTRWTYSQGSATVL